MRKFKTYLLALMATLLAVPSAFAQQMIGRVLAPEELEDGVEVVFEARSGTTSKGRYLFPFTNQSGKTNTCESLASVLDVTDRYVFVLVKSGVPNPVTGMDQYYIKSKETGKYLTFEWDANANTQEEKDVNPDRWVSKYTANRSGVLADDTTNAKRFCLVSNSDEQWKEQYGSNSYGSSQSDWGPDTYTIVNIFDATGCTNRNSDGCGYGRMFLANEFEVSKFNITWFGQYQDTNVWDIRRVIDVNEDARTALEDFLDNFQSDIDTEYKAGTDPGYVTQEVYDEFYTKFSDALVAVGDDSKTDDELKQLFDELLAAKNKADDESNLVQIEDGGYYYITPGAEVFTAVDNDKFGWCAPYEGKYAGWKALKDNDNQFIWQITLMPDTSSSNVTGRKYYAMRNVGSNVYLNRAESHDDSQKVLYSTTPERMFAANLDHAGQFNIGSKYDYYDEYPPRPYHMENHKDGAGTQGYLVLWDGGKNTCSAWYIKKVPQEVIDGIADRAQVDSLRMAVVEYSGLTNGAVVSDKIGFPHSQEIIDNVDSALARANALINAEETPANDVLIAARKELVAAGTAFNTEVNKVPDGYYRFSGAYSPYVNNQCEIFIGVYNDTTLGWKTPRNNKNLEFVWKVTNLANGNYTIQNLLNGKYINKAATASNGSIVSISDQPETDQCFKTIAANGQWGIFNVEDSTWGYDPNGHGSGQNDEGRVHIWSPRELNGGTAWYIEKVSEEEVQDLLNNKEQYTLNVELNKKFREARRAFNAKATYTTGDAIITSVDQIYANNWSTNEGMNLEYMLDGNPDTYWNSTWESGAQQDPENPHYLRFYSENGFPDSIQVKYLMRQNGSWHRVPARMRIQVSDDAENWTSLANEYNLDDLGGYSKLCNLLTDYQTYVVNGIGGHKYVRFITLSSINNGGSTYYSDGHAVFGYAEINLYPITGIADDSFTAQNTHKVASDALESAITKANKELAAGAGTQATYDQLVAALDAFNALESNDSLLVMARYNVENLSSDEEVIGNFPEEALNTYKTTASALIEKLDNASEISVDEVTAAYKGLRDAYNTLYATMYKPTKDVWYVLTTASEQYSGYAAHAGGMHTHAYGLNYSYVLALKNYGETYNEAWFNWTLNEEEDGTFTPQNVGTGGYFGPYTGSGNTKYDYCPILWYKPRSFTIVPFGNGQVGFMTPEGYYVQNNASWYNAGLAYTKPDLSAPALVNSDYAWTIEATEDNHPDMVVEYGEYCNGRAIAITVPYAYNNPATYGSDDATPYELVGKEESEDYIVTAYKLRKIEDEVITAGRPVVYIMPGDYNEEASESLAFTPVYNTAVSAARDTVNGLVSVPATWNTTEEHFGYFLADSVVDEPLATTIGGQRAVIIPGLVKEIPDAEVDAIIYVQGAGMLNNIDKNKVVGIKLFVNVYTTDGVLVRKHVDASKATAGLKKGVYVIGNKKVLVK